MNALGYARVALAGGLTFACGAVALYVTGHWPLWACFALAAGLFLLVGWLLVEAHRSEVEWRYMERRAEDALLRDVRGGADVLRFPTAAELVEGWGAQDA